MKLSFSPILLHRYGITTVDFQSPPTYNTGCHIFSCGRGKWWGEGQNLVGVVSKINRKNWVVEILSRAVLQGFYWAWICTIYIRVFFIFKNIVWVTNFDIFRKYRWFDDSTFQLFTILTSLPFNYIPILGDALFIVLHFKLSSVHKLTHYIFLLNK